MIEQSSDVVVALSGGVDSSFAAASLKMAGWKVHGLHFRFPASLLRTKAREAAVKRVSRCLGIPFGVLDLRETFHRVVIAPFVKEYLKGLTPNPCVVCNQLIKFKYLLDYADRHGIHYIATGHYARVRKSDESPFFQLCRGKDRSKEQSYFLHRLNQNYLSRSIFPLAEKSKNRVRERASAMGLPVHAITESQEICFLPEKDYRGLVEHKGGSEVRKKGNISDENGIVLGEHNGVFRYTIGQRQGLGIASARPYYVKEIRPETGEVIVGRKEAIYASVVEAEGFNWIEKVPSQRVLKAHVQIRYRHRPAPGHLEIISNHKVKFTFDEPQWAVTPGQALVCYEGDRVIGGGWIRRRV